MTPDTPFVPPDDQRRYRTFLALWFTQSFSLVGSFVTYFALVLWLSAHRFAAESQRQELAFALSFLTIALAVPALVASPVFGVWVDRYDRRRLMFLANLANGAVGTILAGLMLTDVRAVWPLFLLMGANSTLTQLHNVAFDASFVMLVPEERLPRANGMMQTVQSIGDVIAPSIVVGFVALPKLAQRFDVLGPVGRAIGRIDQGSALAVGFDAVTFFVAALVLTQLQIPSPARRAPEVAPSIWSEARQGLAFIWDRKPLLSLLSIFAVSNVVVGPLFLLLPLIVRENLVDDWGGRGMSFDSALATLTTAGSIGGVAGGLVITTWGGLRRRRFLAVLVPEILTGGLVLVVGLSHLLLLTAAILMAVTFMEPMVRAHAQAIWQTQTPPALQGRVFSARLVIVGGLIPLGSALAGWSSGAFGAGVVLSVLGIVLAVFCLGQLCNAQMWRLERKPTLVPQPA